MCYCKEMKKMGPIRKLKFIFFLKIRKWMQHQIYPLFGKGSINMSYNIFMCIVVACVEFQGNLQTLT